MPQGTIEELVEATQALIARGDRELAIQHFDALEERDVLQLLDQLDDGAIQQLIRVVGRQYLADLLAGLDPEDAVRHLQRLAPTQAAQLTDRMDPDDAADVISEMGDSHAQRLLAEMQPAGAEDVLKLLNYPPESAGGRMTTEFVAIRADWTVEETIRHLRAHSRDAELIYYIYVVDERERLKGVVSLRDLILADRSAPIAELLNEDVIAAAVDDDQEDVANQIMEEDLLALPVVDFNRRLVGIITVDDVLDVLEDEYSEDLLKFSAIEGGEERPLSKAAFSIRHRLPWLLVNIGLSMIGVWVVSLFEDTLDAVVVLALFMPVISNMGGNVGIQAVSVAIRGISTGEASFPDIWRVIRKESLVGITNGLVLGTLLGVVATVWQGRPFLGVVVMLGLWANVLVASLSGGVLPFLLKRLGRDPAMMTGPLLTTIVDLVSFFIFLGLGTLLLPYL